MNELKNSVLIVDDDPMNLRALTGILNEDYIVYAERHGKNCLESAVSLEPDLILLDVLMPEITGFELIKTLKEHPNTKDIPIIFVTGLNHQDDEVRGLALGAVDYIYKPYSSHVVKMRIQNQLKIVNLIREIQELSMTDVLTGVGNRRFLNAQLEQEWERAKRYQKPISILILDIDHFKQFNDTYGHLNGDEALKSVANVIGKKLERATDKFARWGGEEFAIVLPDTEILGATKVAESIRTAIENEDINIGSHPPCKVTISVGVHCVVPNQGGTCTMDDFISKADDALYHAKRNGRNRVCSVDDLHT
ncbi:MAG: diguanylate cyclase [Defluviitaleaceae bacterium]|nr:diguanylate cyclase [Defluviitaleaceae bacterium]